MVGALSNGYKANGACESEDLHSCNFIVRRDVLEKVRWDEKYWSGEATLMCLGMKKLGKKMVEAPDVVYHHRRSLFIPHLKQVSRFGMHRGFSLERDSQRCLLGPFISCPPTFSKRCEDGEGDKEIEV
ncbi:MAG: glycosyltransferase family 2 protein [Candidatus Hydrothermarchaeales archaeon]